MKDPAVLIYFDKWISSTNGMRAEFRAWYFDLMIYQYDKGSVPNDLDEIAGICRVRPSEYDLFKQMVKQVLEQKFVLTDGVYKNSVVDEVLRKREAFTDKRSKSGNIGVIIKLASTIKGFTSKLIDRLKEDLFKMDIEQVLKHKDKQVLEQVLKLYINVDVDKDIIIDYVFIKDPFKNIMNEWFEYKKQRKETYASEKSIEQCYNKLVKLSNDNVIEATKIINEAMANNYAGFFELKKSKQEQQENKPFIVPSGKPAKV